MTGSYRGRRKWRRPATDFPDRKHAAGVADAFARARAQSLKTDSRFYEELLGGEHAKDQGPEDRDAPS